MNWAKRVADVLQRPLNMNWVRKTIQYKNQIAFAAGLLLPAFVIFIHPAWFQPDDLDAFLRWSQDWAKGARGIYVNCIYCNYPFLGMAFSAGAVDWLGIRDFDGMMGLFRYYLAVIDLLNVVLLYLLLRSLEVKDAAFWAGIVGLLPSSWMGTSYWGQIDNAGQFFILLFLLSAAKINPLPGDKPRRNVLLALAFGILLACLSMTKQLVLFSVISLGSMAVANVVILSRKWTDALLALSILALAFAAPILLVDSLIDYDPQYLSHLHYILATGSSHGDQISSFGFNVWTFFTDDPFGSSHEALSVFGVDVIPYKAGIVLFLLTVILLTAAAIYFHASEYKKGNRTFGAKQLCFWLIHLASVNLCFNLFLTGTHERYLYHFYPFVIAAFLSLPNLARGNVYILAFGAFMYGAFLYGYLTGYNLLFGQFAFRAMTVFHLFVFILVARALIGNFLTDRSAAMDASIAAGD